ncbi:MAG: hypothetical protein GTO45_36655 [Candidatus Aminicenantes bacterium]|nr:hypothetical protein [Candidatus Aminicenantes bacterium]NIM84234.1 hypothetical protein [Candidatus Aminicenantes bacterium]NIN23683.1 hypothetical protein [Candidatus Aminicenantes bacterium]NIN47390.1 hypothetical protein [Candidatus Aminicenantes bacterium]NIN90318.1 hypothetical protein [Candidatus Aminicenantes bacterium]
MKFRRFCNKLLLVVVGLVAAFIFAELILLIFFPVDHMKPPQTIPGDTWYELMHQRSSVPGLMYELAANKSKYMYGAMIHTNSQGMRDSEPLPLSDPSTCNIIAVGDSFTFGFGVAGEDTYPNVLEKLLVNDADYGNRTIQVLNLGVGGYSTRDETLVIKYKGLKWKPTLIIIGYALNDPEIEPFQPLHQYYQKPSWWQYLNTLRLIALVKIKWDITRIGKGDYLRYLHAKNHRSWESVLQSFNEIKSLAQKQNIPVLLLIFPLTRPVPWSQYRYRDLHFQIKEAGENSGFYVIDLLDIYSQYPPVHMMISPGDAHPSPFAHKITAMAVHKVIKENSLKICR